MSDLQFAPRPADRRHRGGVSLRIVVEVKLVAGITASERVLTHCPAGTFGRGSR
ncbi:hypothetical protein AM571_PC00187 (plasmid) [Rhizobium etli 8C-3]|jgi:hypothetical protein|uniref:Uncharacterized protein n=2 Tax=Rhizobium TaxID=379 RepID=A0A1L5PCL5_RHIET|nr:hypothetical protein AM571_PC00187 [Rhizobium etli 8C-3]TCU41091.1 hypothetical protein EV129_101378 [Rhizobium azibense]